MTWFNVEQNTDEWLDMRSGKLTGSNISKVMANYPKSFGVPAKNLAASIACEQVTGKRIQSNQYSNAHMERGHEQEPLSRAAYEREFFIDVSNGGFYDNGNTGCSPDGIVIDGLIEIKSVVPHVHYNNIRRASFDPAYKWQLLFNVTESNLNYIDFVSFCNDYPESFSLYVYRLNKDEFSEDLNSMKERIEEFFCLVGDIKKNMK